MLLGYIGGKMLLEGLRRRKDARQADGAEAGAAGTGAAALLLQGVATSIDALSVGFTIANYPPLMALACSLIIAAVTFALCLGGFWIGKTVGNRLAGRAEVLGGVILIVIGLKIFLDGVL